MKYETPLYAEFYKKWTEGDYFQTGYFVDDILKALRNNELARLKHMINNSPLAKTCIEVLERDPLFKNEN